MLPTVESLGLDRLERTDQLRLLYDLWDHYAASAEPIPLVGDLREELRRRVAEDDESPDDVIPWEEVHAEASARLRS